MRDETKQDTVSSFLKTPIKDSNAIGINSKQPQNQTIQTPMHHHAWGMASVHGTEVMEFEALLFVCNAAH